MSNIYVWLMMAPDKGPKISSIMFIGKEPDCVAWAKRATYRNEILPKIRHELTKGILWRTDVSRMVCRLTAGEGETRIERKFIVNVRRK